MTSTLERATTHERLDRIWSDKPGLVGFFSSVDHKRVGRRYLVTSLTFFVLGGIQALMMRTQLAQPELDLVSPQVFNQLMTMHGTTMIFLFNTTIWAGFGNYFLPLQLGTRDMAFPRLNMLSYWIFLMAGILTYSSLLVGDIPDGGWFAYVPFTGKEYSPTQSIDYWALGMALLGISTTVGGINFIVTTFKMRAPGMTVSRLPIFVWGIVVMSFMMVFALPAVTLAQVLLEFDRVFGFNFFDPGSGGDPVLFQHLFWLWGHPEVYIVFVPATGAVSMIVASLSRTPLAGYLLVATALVAIGFFSFGVWVHHMFTVGLGFMALSFFSAASFFVSLPSGVQFFAWIATLWKGRPSFATPMLWVLGTMFIFLLGGITGVMVAMVPFDFQAQDSYFVVAHFHYTLVGGSVFPVFAAVYYWLPKITGRMLSEPLGKVSFWLAFIGFNVTFFPLHVVGLWGMPRRYYTYPADVGWGGINLVATVGAYALALGFALSFINIFWSMRRGRPAGANPWDADTLEWAISSPPPEYNFLELPRVTSLYPLWEPEMQRVGAEEEPQHDRPVLLPPEGEVEHYTLATGGIDAEAENVMAMPAPSFWPFVVSLAVTTIFYAMLVRQFWVGVVGALVAATGLMGWYWPRWEEGEVELVGEELEEAIR
ncbi:MAG TPA: cytochrome c oxidase subunit I [Nitriliruptorales bacterium]|nr:cytochrome c oxidase subunit I [Nitriliruptorales bacterium]